MSTIRLLFGMILAFAVGLYLDSWLAVSGIALASVYSGIVRSLTPSLTDDNWTLRAGANLQGSIVAVHWGGEATTSTAMHTRIARSSGQTGNATAGNIEKAHPNHATARLGFSTTFATTQPTLEAGDLLAESWNAHGGILYWHAGSPDEEFVLVGAATELCISSRNSVGTAVSSYGATWREI